MKELKPGPVLETERLWIVPLSFPQVEKYLSPGKLEADLKIAAGKRTVNKDLEIALVERLIPKMLRDPGNQLFCTIWTMIEKRNRIMVGDLCFKGAPDENGEIEIGYGTYDEYSGRGFMTEAVGAIRKWALDQEKVRSILAETRNDNIASQRILEKNRFRISRTDKVATWWKTNRTL